jgi:hypothetical protein
MSLSTDSKSSLNILVIDGSCEMTNMLMRVLFCTGHSAKAFNHPVEAISALEKNPDEFDAIITDDFLNNTEMELTGNTLIDALQNIRKLPILVWSMQIDHLKAILPDSPHLSFLHKPEDVKNIFTWLGNIKNTVSYEDDHFPIYQLIYASQAADEFCEKDLMDILHVSRKSNKLAHISGALIYHNHYFLQVLEGEEQAVKTMFHERISKDNRHKAVSIFSEGIVEKRDFRYWNMGFFGQYNHQEYDLLGLTDFETHPAGHFFKDKLTQSQKAFVGDF